MAKDKITQAFILGAGHGTRLKPLTDAMPKVMLPIAPGKPLLEHTIELLRNQGITDFVVNLHAFPAVIVDHFGSGKNWGVNISYSDESERLLETGGAIKKAAPLLHDDFLFLYGDELHFFDFAPLVDLHFRNNALTTIVLKGSEFPQDGDIGEADRETGRILHWYTRPHGITSLAENQKVNAGLYAISKRILDYIPEDGPVKFDGEILPRAFAARDNLYALLVSEPILDIGKPEKYEIAKEYYKRRKGEQ
jgi:mannose-1-phosphate guanylyltransferase/phosphomannomutase